MVVIGGGDGSGVLRSMEKLSSLMRVLSGSSVVGNRVECTPVDVPSWLDGLSVVYSFHIPLASDVTTRSIWEMFS